MTSNFSHHSKNVVTSIKISIHIIGNMDNIIIYESLLVILVINMKIISTY